MIDLNNLKDEWRKEFEQQKASMTDEEFKLHLLQEDLIHRNAEQGELNELDCKVCLNKGFYYKLHEKPLEYGLQYVECACLKARSSLRNIERSGLKQIVEDKTFNSFKAVTDWQKDIKQNAIKYVSEKSKKWFLLSGQVGSGKSHICTAIIGELLKGLKRVVYLPYVEEVKKLKRNATDDKYYSNVMRKWQKCEVLYIDDLFKAINEERISTDVSAVFEVIDYRYRNNLQTIISTERLFQELMDIDGAVASRVFEKCGEYKFQIGREPSKNYRLKGV